ncbi:MAG TPA: alpha/beta hydrolase, partial [Candidatus Obscuribacterales bacterium]
MKREKLTASQFRDPDGGKAFLEYWNDQIQLLNGRRYQKLSVDTQCGPTVVWKHEPDGPAAGTLVFFPGARTCGLFWDLDHVLAPLKPDYRLFLVEVNGQPSLSAGICPDTSVQTYGAWARELLEKLRIDKATIVGASLGGQICLTLCLAAPGRVERAVLVNPAGIRAFSKGLRNLFYNFLPMMYPTEKNLKKFFDQVVFAPPGHDIS